MDDSWFSSRSMCLGQEHQPSEALERAFSKMVPRAFGDATSLLGSFWLSSFDTPPLSQLHVLYRVQFSRLRLADLSTRNQLPRSNLLPKAPCFRHDCSRPWNGYLDFARGCFSVKYFHLHHSSTVASNIVWQSPCLRADDFYSALSAAFSEWLLSWLSFCDV